MKKILIIEDDQNIVENLIEIFEIHDYNVEYANNGIDGIALAKSENPDIIVCDIMMPEMDGYGVLKELKSNLETFPIPFLFLTAKGEKDHYRYGMELGADDYVTKPYKHKDILKAVETKIEKYSKFRKIHENQMDSLRQNIALSLPHEFRTPLNGILGFAQVLQGSYKELDDDEIEMMIENIISSGQRLHSLVINFTYYNNLLGMSKDSPEITEANPTEYVDGILYDYAQAYEEKNDRQKACKVEIGDGIEEAKLKIKESLFRKALEEVVENAFKFSTEKSQIRISAFLDDGYAKIAIENSGRGMSKSQINEIGAFSQFKREEFEQQGSGLGLAIVKRIMDLNNGFFEIKSKTDGITTVTLILPVE